MSLAADEQINPVGGGVRLEGLEEPTPGPRRWIAHVRAIVGLVACDHASRTSEGDHLRDDPLRLGDIDQDETGMDEIE